MRIPLFDIDWTLLRGGNKAHEEAFAHAFRTIYNVEGSIQQIEHSGMTDRQILLAVLEEFEIGRDEALAKMPRARAAMIEYFDARKNEEKHVPLPGVVPTLKLLQRKKIPCGLLTGNTELIAWYKLEAAGIHHFFTFGAFGDTTHRRVELVDIARRRRDELYPEMRRFDLVIVGDSPRDIHCAKEGGLRSVAIASGKFSLDQLAQFDPDLLLDSMQETEKLITFLQH